jgi:DNA-binding Xre family transcriptional regulator
MPKRPLESLGVTVRKKRGQKKLRETAKEIGIGTATLTRIEAGRVPDLETFGKICNWLQIDPSEFLAYEPRSHQPARPQRSLSTITTHYKAEQTPKPETISALVQMVLTAIAAQPGLAEPIE